MATILNAPSLVRSRSAQIKGLGLQTDPHGTVLGGAEILFDAEVAAVDSYSVSASGENLVAGKDALVCQGAFASGIVAARALQFTTTSGNERFQLPDFADLSVLGSGSSVLISMWVNTASSGQTTDWSAIAGYARQTSTYQQWGVSYVGSTGLYDVRINGQSIQFAPTSGTAELITIFLDGSGGFVNARVFQNSTERGAVRSSFPFNDPASSGVSPLYPAIGWMSGFAQTWVGKMHRFAVTEVDPRAFHISEWLSAEISANAGRW